MEETKGKTKRKRLKRKRNRKEEKRAKEKRKKQRNRLDDRLKVPCKRKEEVGPKRRWKRGCEV